MILVPLSFLPPSILRRFSRFFYFVGGKVAPKIPDLKISLEQWGMKVKPSEYVSMCFTASIFNFIILSILFFFLLPLFDANPFIGILVALLLFLFGFIQQLMYPKLKASKRVRDLERNLIPALQNLVIQLESGVPLFNAIATISDSNYGEVSHQFKLAVRRINAGRQQINVLEDLARDNPSLHFRRTLWQISNGLKTGSNMSSVIRLSIDNLSEEQLIQIQKYGSQLNPLAMFYMMVAVIIPSLGVTFVLVLTSFTNLSSDITKMIFWGLFAVTFFFQLMFIGVLKARRPNLID